MKIISALGLTLLIFTAAPAQSHKTEPIRSSAPPAAAAKLPSVRSILDRYVAALGGREAIEKLKSRTASGTLELSPMNLKGTFETVSAPESKSYTKMTIAGIGDMIESSDGRSAWAVNPIQGSREMTGSELAQAKVRNDFYRDIRLDKLFTKMELKGTEKVGGKDAYVITASSESVPEEKWYFDTATGLLLRTDMTVASPEGPQAMSIYYEDLRRVDGVLVPFRVRTETAAFSIVLTSTEVKHGLPVDETKFAKPKS